MREQIASHSPGATRAAMPRSATISMRCSASSTYSNTPLLCSVSHTRNWLNAWRARVAASSPPNTANGSSRDSIATHTSPLCVCSPAAIAAVISSSKAAGKRRRNWNQPSNKFASRRCMRAISPAPRGTAAAEAAAATAETAATETTATTTEAAPAKTAEAAPAAAADRAPGPARQQHEHAPHHRAEYAGARRNQQPQQPTDDRATHRGAHQRMRAAEHAAQEDSRKQRDHEDALEPRTMLLPRRATHRCRQRFALDQLGQRTDRVADAAEVIAAAEFGRDVLADDARIGRVGDRAFQPVTHLDAHGTIIFCDQQQHTVVGALAADLVRLGDRQRILLDRLPVGTADHQHHQLRTLGL